MDNNDIKAIEEADARRTKATLDKDTAALAALFGDDLLYVHGSGTAETKEQYIGLIASRHYDYRSLTQLRRSFRGYGDLVLVDGDVRIQVVVPAGERNFVSRYLQAWAKRDGRWQMVSWQSTPLPAA
ncbi:MAG: nuclear transport factor 2 family protein [Burkholderiaceae bacterium]|nr:nuclear transport factor 2 family protein [Burkholderiaceae bacterium]